MGRLITDQEEQQLYAGAAGVPELFAGAAGYHDPELFAGAAGYHHGAAGYHQGASGYHRGVAGYHQGASGYHYGASGFGAYDFKTHKGFLTPGRRAVLERRCKELGICNQTKDREYMSLYGEVSKEYCELVRKQNNGVGPAGEKGCGGIWPKSHQDEVHGATEAAWKAGRRGGGGGEAEGNKGLLYGGIAIAAVAVLYFAMKK